VIPLHFLNEEEENKKEKPLDSQNEPQPSLKTLAKSIEEMQISWNTETKLPKIISDEESSIIENSFEETYDSKINSDSSLEPMEFDDFRLDDSNLEFRFENNQIENSLDLNDESPLLYENDNKVSYSTQTSEFTSFHSDTEQKEIIPMVSVVIVNYNVRDFLQNCLQSLYKSSIRNQIEVIVVDNNSSDDSMQMVKTSFPFVHRIKLDENIGFGKANNIAIKKCSAPITLLLNPDTIVEEKTLETMVNYLENNPSVGLAGCKLLNADGSFQLPCRRGFPTPWVSFCKVFGLQTLFPNSSLFAQYNQTFKSENETYSVDAVSGAFMVVRTSILKDVKGFDPDFFMYGEDLDLCFRIQKMGWDIAYVHTTSTIHFKGESTKRSTINENKHFYKAMEIFATKHFASSDMFLFFLKLGIQIKALVDKFKQNKLQILSTFIDILVVNFSLLIATKIRMGAYFAFPDFAYPTVFIVFTLLLPTMYLFVGEYDKKTPSFTTTLTSYVMMFFFLSSLTYFFNEYAFSRGIMLMTIGGGIVGSFVVRSYIYYNQKISKKSAIKNAAIVGVNETAKKIAIELKSTQSLRINFLGYITTEKHFSTSTNVLPIIGTVDLLPAIVEKYQIHEIIITDETLHLGDIMAFMQDTVRRQVRFHIANELDDIYTDTLINEVSGIENSFFTWKIVLLRNKIVKRLFDILISTFLLTFGFPFVYLKKNKGVFTLEALKEVLLGRKSIVGSYGTTSIGITKLGLIGLAHRTNPEIVTKQIIENLNEFYAKHYSLSMDIEILLKYIVQKH